MILHFLMLTEKDVVMTENQLEVLQYFLALILSPGGPENKPQCQDQVQKLSTNL